MHRHLLKVSLLLLMLALKIPAQDTRAEKSIELGTPVCKIISLPYLLGEVALSMGNEQVIKKRMRCLVQLWEAQLPNASDENTKLSNSFLFVMGENPRVFFSSMSAEPDVFSKWLGTVQSLSFSTSRQPRAALMPNAENWSIPSRIHT